MQATYTWEIKSMKCYPLAQGNENVVFSVDWACTATQGTHSAYDYGSCGIQFAGGKYIPYENLKNEDVVKWIWANGVDKEEIEKSLQGQINAKMNPKSVEMSLPWRS